MKSGKLRAIAVTTAKRNPAWPEVPIISESGLPGYESLAWYAPGWTGEVAIIDTFQTRIGNCKSNAIE